MKSLFTICLLAVSLPLMAQFGTAHDFTVVDIEGNSHHLYEILDDGKPVVLDVSATWCSPCWTLHQTHALENLHVMYGPDGTDQIRVLFYEADPGTGLNALMGTGGNTRGNWLDGASYPFINESPITLNLNLYAPLGYPTVNLIRPSDREITADMWNYSLAQMENSLNQVITLGNPTSVDDLENALSISTFPNPAIDQLNFDIKGEFVPNKVEIVSLRGQVILSQTFDKSQGIDVSALNGGTYMARLSSADEETTVKFVKY